MKFVYSWKLIAQLALINLGHGPTDSAPVILLSIYFISLYLSFKEAVEHKEPPGIILRIADEIDICPVLVARFVLEAYIREQQEKEFQKYGSSKTNDAEDKIPNEETQVLNLSVIRGEVNRLLKDNTAIEDRDLAYEVFLVK